MSGRASGHGQRIREMMRRLRLAKLVGRTSTASSFRRRSSDSNGGRTMADLSKGVLAYKTQERSSFMDLVGDMYVPVETLRLKSTPTGAAARRADAKAVGSYIRRAIKSLDEQKP